MSLWDINAHLDEGDFELEFQDVDVKNSLLFDEAFETTRNITFSDMPTAEVVDEAIYAQTYSDDYLYQAVNGFARKVERNISHLASEDEVQYIRARTVYDQPDWKLAAEALNLPRDDPILFSAEADELDPLLNEEFGFAENITGPVDENEQVVNKLHEHLASCKHLLSDEEFNVLSMLVLSRRAAFGLTKSGVRQSKLTPVRCELVPGHAPISANPRPLASEKLEFTRTWVDELIKVGLLEIEPHPTYSSNIFVVPKKGKKRFRVVIDLRPLNNITVKTTATMPHLESQLRNTKGSRWFGGIDLLSGFDYLPIEASSQ